MERKDELKDILLDREDDLRKTKLKKVLVTIGALSILFLIVIATMKILNTDDMNTNLAGNNVDSRLVLPPMPDNDTKQISSQAMSDKKSSDQLFEQVPILPENKAQDDFENMVKKLKEKENPKAETPSNAPIIDTKPVPEKTPVVVAKQEDKPKIIAETKKLEPKIIKEAKKDEPKDDKKNKTAKPATTQQTTSSPSVETGAYVQVSATAKINPDQRELNKISAKGYTYKTLRVGNTTKVLIGPFSGAKLQSELANIRKEINKDAFIYRVK